MDSNDGWRSPAHTFDNLAMSEKVKLIRSQVIVTLLEHPPSGVEPGSYSGTKDFLQKMMQSACEELFEHHKSIPGLISDGAMQLLTFIRAYKLVGQAVPRHWADLCQNELKSVDEKRTREDFSKDYDLFFHEQMRKQELSGRAILQTFINKADTTNTDECDSRKRRRTEVAEEEAPHRAGELASDFEASPFEVRLDRKGKLLHLNICPDGETESILFEVRPGDHWILDSYSKVRGVVVATWGRFARRSPRHIWLCLDRAVTAMVARPNCRLRHHGMLVQFVDGEDDQVRNFLKRV